MKRYLLPVYAGINGQYDSEEKRYKFKVDFDNNTSDDVVKFIEPYYRQSRIDNYTYWFGYSFNDGQSTPRRDEFIEFMKHVQPIRLADPDDEWSEHVYTDDNITEEELSEMLYRSMNRIGLDSRCVDTIVYPESKSSNLVGMIVKLLSSGMPHVPAIKEVEVLKASPAEIQFDFDAFHKDIESGNLIVPDFVTDDYIENMMNDIHRSDSFSLRRSVHPVSLRPYVSGFYKHTDATFAISKSDVVLIVDDFGTSGTTIRELIRVIRSINTECEIFIFTLMGNRRAK